MKGKDVFKNILSEEKEYKYRVVKNELKKLKNRKRYLEEHKDMLEKTMKEILNDIEKEIKELNNKLKSYENMSVDKIYDDIKNSYSVKPIAITTTDIFDWIENLIR